MKYNAKDIKKLGRAYGKRVFKLTENDYIELAQIEQAYLAGFKAGYKQFQIEAMAESLCLACEAQKDGYEHMARRMNKNK